MEDRNDQLETIAALIDKLKKLEQSEVWYKYTQDRFFSKINENYYFLIRKGELLYHELEDDGVMRRYEIFNLICELINHSDDELYAVELERIYDDFEYVVDVVCESVKNVDPIIDKIFKLDEIKKFGKTIFHRRDGSIFERDIKSKEDLELALEDDLDDIGKIEIEGKIWLRHQLLTEKYLNIETNILLEEENYEMLGWFKKLKE